MDVLVTHHELLMALRFIDTVEERQRAQKKSLYAVRVLRAVVMGVAQNSPGGVWCSPPSHQGSPS